MGKILDILLKIILSPFILSLAVLLVFIRYLYPLVSSKILLIALVVFLLLVLFYLLIAFIFRNIFRFFLNSVSLKLTGFYVTTAFVPFLLLMMIVSALMYITIGVNESYVLKRALSNQYGLIYNAPASEMSFAYENRTLFFKSPDGKRDFELKKTFFDNIHNLTGIPFRVDVKKDTDQLKKDLSKKDFEKLDLSALTNTVYSTEKVDIKEKIEIGIRIFVKHINYAMLFPVSSSEEDSSIMIVSLKINIIDFYSNLFLGKDSFSQFNKFALTVFLVFIIVLFVFQVYLFFRGVFYMKTIASSAGYLKQGAKEIEKGNFDYRIGVLEDEQLGEIGDTFNKMASNIKHLFNQLMTKQQIEQELEIAKKIQSAALSLGFFEERTMKMAVYSEPSRIVGGDYFNFFKRENGVVILAGDVSGKGVGAAMYVSEVDGLFSALASRGESGQVITEELHSFFLRRGNSKSFFTATLLDINFVENTIEYFRLGDPPVLVRDNNGQWKEIKPKGLPAGVRGVSNFLSMVKPELLKRDDINCIFVFSDGFYEIMDSSLSVIKHLLEKHYSEDISEFYHAISALSEQSEDSREKTDDVTFAIINLPDFNRQEG